MKKDLLNKGIIPAINYHLWDKCNMNCKFCFGQFKNCSKNVLDKDQSIKLIKMFIEFGFKKITFSGGEPTLCPWLTDLIQLTKSADLVTCIVTNGSKIDPKWLEKNYNYLDWIALSIDSINPTSNIESGRCLQKETIQDEKYYLKKIELIKQYNIKIKINTVVSKYNLNEDLSSFIKKANPSRWKLFQALPIEGENSSSKENFIISNDEFDLFKAKHSKVLDDEIFVPESNEEMTSSYLMVDPNGCFFDNTSGYLNHSDPITEKGITCTMKQCHYDIKKFIARKGIYKW